MSITNVDRIGGFVVGNEANYNASAFGKSIFFAPDTKQILVDGVKYIPKSLSELTDDKGFLLSSSLGIANGIATLDNSGKVPSTQLPSYVDDVLEYSSSTAFPSIGESGKIYVDTNSNKTYRWSGSMYAEISKSLSLGTTSSTAYRGDLGVNNANNIATLQSYFESGVAKEASKVSHSLTVGSKVFNGSADISIAKADLGLGNVENTKLSTWAGSTSITTLGTIQNDVRFLRWIRPRYIDECEYAYVDELQVGDSAFFNNDVQIDGFLNCTSDVNVDGATSVRELIIGTPHLGKSVRLYYDVTNECLRVDKGIASDSFVSAGGIEESSTIAELQQRVAQLEAQLISLTNK